MFKLKKKSIITIALLACLVFVVGFYNLPDSQLPKEVDKALKRNGIKNYTVMEENPKSEFNDFLLKDKVIKNPDSN